MTLTNIGFKGTVDEVQWAKLAQVAGNGYCMADSNHATISQVSGERAVTIGAGGIFGDGVLTTIVPTEKQTLPTITNGQWFLLVLNRVWASATSAFALRPGPTTATAGPPATVPGGGASSSFPATYKNNPGVESDVPVAWLWGNSSSTTVTIVPLLLPPSFVRRSGTSAQRLEYWGKAASTAPFNDYREGADWFNTDFDIQQLFSNGGWNTVAYPKGFRSFRDWYRVSQGAASSSLIVSSRTIPAAPVTRRVKVQVTSRAGSNSSVGCRHGLAITASGTGVTVTPTDSNSLTGANVVYSSLNENSTNSRTAWIDIPADSEVTINTVVSRSAVMDMSTETMYDVYYIGEY